MLPASSFFWKEQNKRETRMISRSALFFFLKISTAAVLALTELVNISLDHSAGSGELPNTLLPPTGIIHL